MMENLPWAAIAGILLIASLILTIAFLAMCRRNDQQEPQDERHDDIH